jgi:hypothetical protein
MRTHPHAVLALLLAAAPGVGRAASPVPGVPQRGPAAVEVAEADREASAALSLAVATLPQTTLAGALPQTTLGAAPRAGCDCSSACSCGCRSGHPCDCDRRPAPESAPAPVPVVVPQFQPAAMSGFSFGGFGGGCTTCRR